MFYTEVVKSGLNTLELRCTFCVGLKNQDSMALFLAFRVGAELNLKILHRLATVEDLHLKIAADLGGKGRVGAGNRTLASDDHKQDGGGHDGRGTRCRIRQQVETFSQSRSLHSAVPSLREATAPVGMTGVEVLIISVCFVISSSFLTKLCHPDRVSWAAKPINWRVEGPALAFRLVVPTRLISPPRLGFRAESGISSWHGSSV